MKSKKTTSGFGHDIPPAVKAIKIYFDQKGASAEMADAFFRHYQSRSWKTDRGCPLKDWKAAANNWIWQHRLGKPITLEVKLRLLISHQL